MPEAHSTNPRPILLVHGAWHGAWCWSALQAELDRRGVPSHAIDLPGHGSSLAPFGGLFDDANHVRATLDRLARTDLLEPKESVGPTEHIGRDGGYADAGFVLVGHSYGGAVITQAALQAGGGAREDIAHLVYVAAFALNPGESVSDALRSFPKEDSTQSPKANPDKELGSNENLLRRAMQAKADGSSTLDPKIAADVLYGDCTPSEAAAAIRRLCPQPGATMIEAPQGDPRQTTPSTYVKCLRDRAIDPAHQTLMASRCTDSIDLDTDHSPFMSQTAALAEILERIATRP